MIKALTFDLDGVYFTSDSFQKFKNSLPKKETDPDKVNWVLYKSPEMLAFKCGKMTESAYWAFAKSQLGISISNQDIFKLLRDSYSVDPKVHGYLLEMKQKGLIACICSNNFETRIRELNTKFDFLRHFDVQIFSYKTGVMKPDIKIFEELISRSKVKSNEIVYSDDDTSKLSGALKLGINAFVYQGFEDFQTKITSLITS